MPNAFHRDTWHAGIEHASMNATLKLLRLFGNFRAVVGVIFSYLSSSAANLGEQNTWWTWCPALLRFRCDLDWNKSDAADGKKAGRHSEGWQSQAWWSGCKCKAGGGTMSLWVILLTGNHAALIVVIGFPWKQRRLGTPKRNFIEFYLKAGSWLVRWRLAYCLLQVGLCIFMFIYI